MCFTLSILLVVMPVGMATWIRARVMGFEKPDKSFGDLAEEFLRNDWQTYGLIELKQDVDFNDVNRVDRVTEILSRGNIASLEEALRRLRECLAKPENIPQSVRIKLQLRRVFVLRLLGDYRGAVKEALKLQDGFQASPALNCLVGSLYSNHSTREDWLKAVKFLDAAIELAEEWWEPKLEKLERLLYLGLTDEENWRIAAADGTKWLRRVDTMTGRERMILLANSAVADALLDPSYIKSKEFAQQKDEALECGKAIPDHFREAWDFLDVFRNVVRRRYSGEDPMATAVRTTLRDFLCGVHSFLKNDHPWEDN